jgi:hypothetical protein
MPWAGCDEVAFMHDGAFPVHVGMRATTLEDKAQGALGVAVSRGYLSRQYELHTRIKVGGDFRLPAQAGVLEHKNAAFRFLRGDE